MSERRRDSDYLEDIREAIQRIQAYTEGMKWRDYAKDYKTQDAVLRNLEVLGEATKSLSEQVRTQYSYIPWKELAGMRDKLIHHYFGINHEIVWQIVEQDLPALLPQIDSALKDLE